MQYPVTSEKGRIEPDSFGWAEFRARYPEVQLGKVRYHGICNFDENTRQFVVSSIKIICSYQMMKPL